MKPSKTCGIYQILNQSNGKRYIGQSSNIEQRFVRHRSSLKTGKHQCQALQSDYDLGDQVAFEILVTCVVAELAFHEKSLIAMFDTTNPACGYNVSPGGGRSNRGFKFSEEHNRRISEAISGSKHWNWGRHPSAETLRRMSESNRGDKSAWYGRKHTNESKAKISVAMRGRKHPFPQTVRDKLSMQKLGPLNHFYGKNHTDDTKRKMSDGQEACMVVEKTGEGCMTIEICVSCTFFQKRLCWMMSSCMQQTGDVPHLTFNVAYPVNNGNPTTEQVCAFFKGRGLDVKETVYPDERAIQFRGLVRNRQLAESTADWILFSDSDMVYSETFFATLGRMLKNELADETRCISASRVSLDKEKSKTYFNVEDTHAYPTFIDHPAAVVKTWPVFQISKNCGAGYFQLVNVAAVRRLHGGLYVDPKDCADKAEFDDIHKTRSDSQFRHRVGGLKRIGLPPQYHLNHERDNEVGHHLTIQR